MGDAGPIQILLTAGAIAALLLFLLSRRLPLLVNFVLGLVAITAIAMMTATGARSAILPLITGLLHTIGLSGDGVQPVLSALTEPAQSLLGSDINHLVAVCVDLSYWTLIQLVAVASIVACVGRVPLPGEFERLRGAFEQRWPDGGQALLITILAAALLMAGPVVAQNWGVPTATTRGIVVALLIVLRIWLPRLVSWGAWILAMMVLPHMVLQQIVDHRTLLAGIDVSLLAPDAVAALLILAGPRRDAKSTWPRLLCVVAFVLPGLGWLARPFLG